MEDEGDDQLNAQFQQTLTFTENPKNEEAEKFKKLLEAQTRLTQEYARRFEEKAQESRGLFLEALPIKINTISSLEELIELMVYHGVPTDVVLSGRRQYRESLLPTTNEASSALVSMSDVSGEQRKIDMRAFHVSDMLHPPSWRRIDLMKDGNTDDIDNVILSNVLCSKATYFEVVEDLIQHLDIVRSVILASTIQSSPSLPAHSVWSEVKSLQPLATLYFQYFLKKFDVTLLGEQEPVTAAVPVNGLGLSFSYLDKLNSSVTCSGYSDLAILPLSAFPSSDCSNFRAMVELKAPLSHLMCKQVKEKHQLLSQLLAMRESKATAPPETVYKGVLTDLFALYIMFLKDGEMFVTKRVYDSKAFVRYLLYLLAVANPVLAHDSRNCKGGDKERKDSEDNLEDEDEDDEDGDEEHKEERQVDNKPARYMTRSQTKSQGSTGEKKPRGRGLADALSNSPFACNTMSGAIFATTHDYRDDQERAEEYQEEALIAYNMFMKHVLKEPLVTDENLENRRQQYVEDGKLIHHIARGVLGK